MRNKHLDSPFDHMPVATWVLAIGIVVAFAALIYINYLM